MSPTQTPPPRTRTKAIVAIAAGTALLLGGAGTYAVWSTSEALTVGPVETGDLDLVLGAGTWTIDGLLTDPAPVADVSAVRIVPGDVLTLAQPLEVTLEGDTIAADLSVAVGDLVAPELAQYVTVTFESTTLGTATGANTFRITPADAGTVETTVSIAFSAGTPDRVLTNTLLDLTAVAFALEQATS